MLETQWQTIPPEIQKRICAIHLKRIRKIAGKVLSDVGEVIAWDCDTLILSDHE